jgi:REP element-mobilizing transposase RayT
VEKGVYFITFRCVGSLPESARLGLLDIYQTWRAARNEEVRSIELQRRIFALLETFLDRGDGFAPFRGCEVINRGLQLFDQAALDSCWDLGSLVLMPNHVHLLARAREPSETGEPLNLGAFVNALKGRTSRELNALMGRKGRFWQPDWFDRWCRSPAEVKRFEEYIRLNPVKAGLASRPESYPGYRRWARLDFSASGMF